MSGVITCLVPLEVQLTPGASYLPKEGIFIWNSQEPMEETNEAPSGQLKKSISGLCNHHCHTKVQSSKKPFENVIVTLNRREIEASGGRGKYFKPGSN